MPTELTVKTIEAAATGEMLFDAIVKGLIFKCGRRDRLWVLQLRFPGRKVQTKRTLGKYPGMGLAEARRKAVEWRQLVERGSDPAEVVAAAEAAVAEARRKANLAKRNTFEAVAEAYIAGRGNRRAHKDALTIRRHLVKAWGSKPVGSITPRDVRELIGGIAKKSPHGANEAWGHAAMIFKHAVHDELIAASPCASLDKKLVIGAKLEPRKRMLTDDEIAALWRAAVARSYPEGHAVRWLMLSACRLSEALGMRWQELHPELRRALRDNGTGARTDAQRVWTIPGDRTGNKSGEQRLVPITDAMLDVLASVPVRGGEELVFSHDGEHQLGSLSKLKAWIDKRMLRTLKALARKRGDDPAELAGWVLHDLRRVVRSHLSALKVDFTVAELCIGHGKKGVQRIYDQWSYVPEMRAALDAWNKRLLAMVR